MLGPTRAAELILTGAMFGADEAADIGLVSRAVDADSLLNETEIAETLIGGAVITAGDVVIDGSLRARLDGLANALIK